MSNPNEIKLIPISNRIAVKRNYILYPIDSIELINALARSNTGYMVAPRRGPTPPLGSRLDAVGPIARKGETTIDFDYVSQIIGVNGSNPREVTATLAEVESIIRDDLKINIDENIRFYESSSNYQVNTGKNPLKELAKITAPKDLYSSLSDILGMPIAAQALHISQKSETIENPEWFDMDIKPLPHRATYLYDVTTIFRRLTRSPVVEFLISIESITTKLLQTIESYRES